MLSDILLIYAKKGDLQARQTLFEMFNTEYISRFGTIGDEAIAELDGINGVIYIANILGNLLQIDSKYWDDGTFFDEYQQSHPDQNVYDILRVEGEINPAIKHLIAHIVNLKEINRRPNKPRVRLTYDEVKRRIYNFERHIIFPKERDNLLPEEIKRLAYDFSRETSHAAIFKYLIIFRYYPYLLNINHLLRLFDYRGLKTSHDSIIWALRNNSHEKIRKLALIKIKSAADPSMYADLLVKNFKNTDLKILEAIALKLRSSDKIENFACSCISISKENQNANLTRIFEILYKKMNCAICRNSIIEILLSTGKIPAWIKNEIRYDSYPQTRDLVKGSTSI